MPWFQRATEGKVGMGGVPERLLGTGLKVQPKLQWRTQDVDESRTTKHFWLKDMEWELSQEAGNRASGGWAFQALWNSRYPT